MAIVYKITNPEDGRFYVGSTINSAAKRLLGHLNVPKSQNDFHLALKRLGANSFIIDTLWEGREVDIKFMEKMFIYSLAQKHPNLIYNFHKQFPRSIHGSLLAGIGHKSKRASVLEYIDARLKQRKELITNIFLSAVEDERTFSKVGINLSGRRAVEFNQLLT